MVIAIDNFFGCYLLYCTNPKYKGRTYIGFTVNPERRIQQHNAGKLKGGAWKTSGKGPWDMTLIVHGFPSDIAALRFEWAWQNPQRSRRLKHVPSKQRKESKFQYYLRVMANMLHQTPWSKLPITVQWLKQEYALDLDPIPPPHMPIAYGPVSAKVKRHKNKRDKNFIKDRTNENLQAVDIQVNPSSSHRDEAIDLTSDDDCEGYTPLMDRLQPTAEAKNTVKNPTTITKDEKCVLCSSSITDGHFLNCVNESCTMKSHLTCLAKRFLLNEPPNQLLPIEGTCPSCNCSLLWGELIRHSQGFHQYL